MTQAAQNPPTPQHYVIHPPATNNLAVAGFITSLVGLVTCGVLSPIGFVFSAFGMMKPPRGFAIAGLILGAIGSIFLALMGIGIVMGLLGLKDAAKSIGDFVGAQQSAREALVAIHDARRNSATPTETALNAAVQKFKDPWGTPPHVELHGDSITVIIAGPDKAFGTNDDLRFSEKDLEAFNPSTQSFSR